MTGGFRLHGFGFHLAALVIVACLIIAGSGATAAAERTGEARSLTARIEQLERDMQAQTGGSAQANAAELTARVAALEESLRTLTGQVEELNHKLQQLGAQTAAANPNAGSGTPVITTPDGSNTNSAVLTPPPPPPPAAGTLGTLKTSKTPVAALPVGDENAQFDAAFKVLYRGDYAGGAQAFQSFIEQHPSSSKLAEAHYWLGEAQFTQKDYRGAAQTYLTLVKQYSKSDKAPDSMVKLGRSLLALDQKKAGCDTLASVATMKPVPTESVLQAARTQQTKAGCK